MPERCLFLDNAYIFVTSAIWLFFLVFGAAVCFYSYVVIIICIGDLMDKQKIIIAVLIVIIAVILIAMASSMFNFSKQDTELKFKGNSTLSEGEYLKIKLTDSNGTALQNQTVNITLTDKDNAKSYFTVQTNGDGVGKLKIDKGAGEYSVTISYGGNDKYNPSNATKKIKVEKKVEEVQASAPAVSQESSSSDVDSGAFYSKQAGKVIETGDVMDGPGGKMRHLGNNKWEPA